MFTLDVYFTVHFTIRFSSPFAVSWFMVLQILSACPAQSMDLEKNLPGDSPCPCCCSVYNCPYLWVKLEQFLPNSDKLVSYFPVLTLLFWGMGGSGSQKKTRANKCDAKGWPQLPSDFSRGWTSGCWGLLAWCGTAKPAPHPLCCPADKMPYLAMGQVPWLLRWSVTTGGDWSLPALCHKGLTGAAGINQDYLLYGTFKFWFLCC